MTEVWSEALSRAGRLEDDPARGGLLFFEDREDLRIEMGPEGDIVSVHTRQRGLSAHGSVERPRLTYLADPAPDEVEEFAALARHSDVPPRRARLDACGPEPSDTLDPVGAAALLRRLVEETTRHEAGARVHAHWIGLHQVAVAAGGAGPPREDVRRGARVRLDARLRRGSLESSAVAEAVLPAGPTPAAELAERLGRQLARRLHQRLDPRRAPAGEASVVLAPGVGGVLAHEVVGHALEADVALDGSCLAGTDDLIAFDELTVVDDPRRGRAAWRRDDQGETARPTALIRGGRVRGWLHDRTTARLSGQASTGHGRCSSYREPIRPRMGCTFIAAGRSQAGDIVGSTDRGIYVRRMEAASVDPRGGRAVFRVTDSDLILDGSLDAPLRPHVILVEARKVLRSIDRIAGDLCFDTVVGSCHRDGQPLAISVGAPTIRIGVVKVAT